jgi:hypothetical protein
MAQSKVLAKTKPAVAETALYPQRVARLWLQCKKGIATHREKTTPDCPSRPHGPQHGDHGIIVIFVPGQAGSPVREHQDGATHSVRLAPSARAQQQVKEAEVASLPPSQDGEKRRRGLATRSRCHVSRWRRART